MLDMLLTLLAFALVLFVPTVVIAGILWITGAGVSLASDGRSWLIRSEDSPAA